MASVTVSQLHSKRSDTRGAFLNVKEDYGSLEVWGSLYGMPTFIFRAKGNSNEFHLVQFDNEDPRTISDYMKGKSEFYTIHRLEIDGLVEVRESELVLPS